MYWAHNADNTYVRICSQTSCCRTLSTRHDLAFILLNPTAVYCLGDMYTKLDIPSWSVAGLMMAPCIFPKDKTISYCWERDTFLLVIIAAHKLSMILNVTPIKQFGSPSPAGWNHLFLSAVLCGVSTHLLRSLQNKFPQLLNITLCWDVTCSQKPYHLVLM